MTEFPYAAPADFSRLQRGALAVGVAALVLCVLGAFFSPAHFLRAYLLGYVFWIGITLGCLAIVMLHHLSGGGWGLIIRRVLESATRTLPLMAVLFLPIAIGVQRLYVWARPEEVTRSPILLHKAPYLNVGFFLMRAGFYFAVWLGMSYLLNKWSREQDQSADPGPMRRLEAVSGPGLVLFGLTVTFASIDWVMSLEPAWFSSIFGILFMGGQALSAIAFVTAITVVLAGSKPMSEIIAPRHLHDLGKLMLAFVMLWAYFAFSQFLIIWSGNLPEETPWYFHRLQSGWKWVGLILILFHFVLPFLLLLSRDLKRNGRRLAIVALVVIVMRLVDLFWLIAPEFSREAFQVHWMDVAAPVGLGGIWVAFFTWQLRQRPLLPLHDPRIAEL